ncbi:ATP-dependent endonuclease [Acaryochloris marina]|uniref:ATP-dependent nuclease n=1 Tax=Acaryochloris marina TaxID=155978 RepID=UPI001BB05CEB|nr:AAA family ATPase [Acaryochloris marina]QUY41042.1 AAA family ATPase [Acaryochloris marina S15]
MKLENVIIKRFRSIEDAKLDDCGEFNVLIGKNNSGKSSALSAINAFFKCINNGEVLNLSPNIGKEIDFFNKESQYPIEINLVFSLKLSERDALIRDIATEAPQMKNAVDGINPSLHLSVALVVMPPPSTFSYIQKVSLGGIPKSGVALFNCEGIILSVDERSALELYDNFLRSKELDNISEDLNSLDLDGLRRYIRPDLRDRPPLEYLARKIDGDTIKILEERVGTQASIEDLKSAIPDLSTSYKEESISTVNKVLSNKIGTFAGEEASIPHYVKTLLKRIGEINVLYLTEKRKRIGKEEAERLLSLKTRRGGFEALKNIQETVSALLGVYVDAFESDSSISTNQMSAEMDVDNFLVGVNGSGIKEALRLLLDVEFEHPDILLVEEPEIHLHPALETSMMRYLKRISCDCQVFITTHSTNFLDTAEMNNVYLVTKPNSTQIRQIDIGEAEAKIPQELGIRLSSLFMFDRLVFVEGITDEDAIREWASVLGVNLSQANVGFIRMGGARNFAHFATEETLNFLAKRQVRMWFLIDRDEKDDSEILKMQARLGENAKLKVLNKREVENYLICPRAVRSFIEYKRKISNTLNQELPTENEVQDKINGCAENLKQFAICKRVVKIVCKPIYPETKSIFEEFQDQEGVDKITESIQSMISQLETEKRNLESIYTSKIDEIENIWESKKMDIVPGDLLLDEVCKEYNLRFKKEKDTSKLASLMRKDEIDSEIKSVIQEIVV